MTRILRQLLVLNAIAAGVLAIGAFVQIPGHWLDIVYREGSVAADTLLIGPAGVWLTWVARAVTRARAIDHTLTMTPAYAVAAHVVPIANLIMPYRVMVALAWVDPDPLMRERVKPMFAAWWACWLGSTLLSIWAYAGDNRTIDGIALLALVGASLLARHVIGMVDAILKRAPTHA